MQKGFKIDGKVDKQVLQVRVQRQERTAMATDERTGGEYGECETLGMKAVAWQVVRRILERTQNVLREEMIGCRKHWC